MRVATTAATTPSGNESNPLRGIDLTPWAPFPAREGGNLSGGGVFPSPYRGGVGG